MVRTVVKDEAFLKGKSSPATEMDQGVAQDLLDTLKANESACVGMAANMIGIKKRIIVVNMGFFAMPMYNPVITKKQQPFETEEGCLSLTGTRKTKRYKVIEVEYYDHSWKKQKQTFKDWPAQIIQHEVDHLEGIII